MFRVGINILWQDEANNGRGGKCMKQSNKRLGKGKIKKKRKRGDNNVCTEMHTAWEIRRN